MIGKLQWVDLREIWKHEALDFTKWLFDNCDILNEHLGLSLTPLEREKSVGPFNVDILAEDINGKPAIIENQLERTDHDHLGKLLTYLSNLGAKMALWVSSDPRPEHITAVNYLNEVLPQDTQFFLIKIEAFTINESDPAPLFTIVAGPSEERTAGGNVKKEFAEQDKKRYDFFKQLLDCCNKKTNLFNSVSPVSYQNWVNTGAGKAGIMWTFVALKRTARVEFFLCSPTAEINKKRYENLFQHKEKIEEDFGEPLLWDYKETRKQQYIRTQCRIGGLDDKDKWDEVQSDMVEGLLKLEKTLKPYIKNLE